MKIQNLYKLKGTILEMIDENIEDSKPITPYQGRTDNDFVWKQELKNIG